MKCININDPLVKDVISAYGQVSASLIVDYYNKNYADQDFNLELANFIYNRIRVEESKHFERPIVAKYLMDIERLEKELQIPGNYEAIQSVLNRLNWSEIIYLTKNKLKQSGVAEVLRKETESLKDLTPREARQMAEGIVTYLTNAYNYLDKVKKELSAYLEDPNIPTKEKYTRGYHTLKMMEAFSKELSIWDNSILTNLPDTNIVKRTLKSINVGVIPSVATLFKNEALDAVAEEFANELAPQTKALQEANLKEIETVKKELEKAKDPGVQSILKKRIEQLEQNQKLYATPQNLKNAILKGDSSQSLNYIKLLMENASFTSNIITGTVGSYLYNLHMETQRDVMAFETQMKDLSKEMVKDFKGRLVGEFSKDEFMKPYVREVTKMRIKKDGTKEYYKTYDLNSEMDEQGYALALAEMRYELSQEKDPDKAKILETRIKRFRDENEDKGYTEEYYRIYFMLSPEAREARKKITDEIQKLSGYAADDFLDEGTLLQVAELRFELDRLESLYYANGQRKPKGSLDERIALEIQAWKKEKNANNLFSFAPSVERMEEFNSRLNLYKDTITQAEQSLTKAVAEYEAGKVAYSAVNEANAALRKAKRDFSVWKKSNLKREISKDFFAVRKIVTDKISAIQSKYLPEFRDQFPNLRTDNEIWDDIFNLLKGYRDQDNVYRGNEISEELAETIKALQTELYENRKLFKELKRSIGKKNEAASKKDKDALNSLYKQLAELQTQEQTVYYEKAYASRLGQIRSIEIHKRMDADRLIKLEYNQYYDRYVNEARRDNPNATKAEHDMYANQKATQEVYLRLSKQDEEIEKETQKKFRSSKWFQSNHMKMDVWDETAGEVVEKDVPLYFWNEVLPRNEVYMNYEAPSSKWSSFSVNPEFVRSDFKYIPGRTQLRKSSAYRNEKYDRLSDKQKELLQRLTDIYLERQEDTPFTVAKGLELPSVRKRGQTNLVDFINPIKQIRTHGTNLFDEIRGVDEESDEALKGTNPDETSSMAQYRRRLMLRYVSPMDSSIQSIDALTSIFMFGSDAIRFGKLFEKSPYLYGMSDLLANSNAGANTVKMVHNLYDKVLFGKGTKTLFSKGKAEIVERALYKASDSAVSLSSKLYTSYKIPLAIKNFAANLYNAAIQSGTYDINPLDITKGIGLALRKMDEIYMSSIQTGNESDFVKKLRFFGIYDEAMSEKGRALTPTDMQKLNLVGKVLPFFREGLDITTRVGTAIALANKFTFLDNNGNDVTIFDAFDIQDGKFVPRTDLKIMDEKGEEVPVTSEMIENIRLRFVGKYHSIDALINGAQKGIDQGEIKRYALGRSLMMMKSWLTYQTIRRVGGKRISYGGAFEYEGMYYAASALALDFFRNLPLVIKNFNAWAATVSTARKKAALAALYDTVAIYTLQGLIFWLSSTIYGNDPEDKKYKYGLYLLATFTDEIETLHPIAGPWSMYYARELERNNKDNALTYYGKKWFMGPYETIKGMYRQMDLYGRADVDMFDPYVPRTAAGNVRTRKDIPINPALEGHSELTAYFLQVTGMATNINLLSDEPQYLYNSFTHYYPKYYINDMLEDIENLNADAREINKRNEELYMSLQRDISQEREETIRLLIEGNETKLEEIFAEREKLIDIKGDWGIEEEPE
jgi:hypothetical protein